MIPLHKMFMMVAAGVLLSIPVMAWSAYLVWWVLR